ncbi:MAG: anthranilate synthase component I [Planctomycetota bacterium]
MPSLSRDEFLAVVSAEREGDQTVAIPVCIRVLSDQLTPVLAYRRLVAPDERTAPSFLLESVEGSQRQARYSILGSRPRLEVVAFGNTVTVRDHTKQMVRATTDRSNDPIETLRRLADSIRLVEPSVSVNRGMLPECVWGGWFGYASYDSVRYAEPEKLHRMHAPEDDRKLPDLHFGLYDGVCVFDHAEKLVYLVQLALVGPNDDPEAIYEQTIRTLDERAEEIERHSKPLPAGRVGAHPPPRTLPSNMTRREHEEMVEKAQEYIRAGDIFQVVVGQRFERRSIADPFDVYRALRAVNPSPYMVYMQAGPCILVASSPEILCRVERNANGESIVTNRPLAGTRPRGRTTDEDAALERDLLSDPKECAEHVMLVDLGRNDVGKVARPGSIRLSDVMTIERYSHVMHISSTVTGALRDDLDAWDALRAALPVGTISGAPKIRAMQIIDELEPVRRGPYGGGMGYVGLDGQMDIALALRTIVVPTDAWSAGASEWVYYVQAAGGIVADSKAGPEFEETVNKAGALGRAIDLAEEAFGPETDA